MYFDRAVNNRGVCISVILISLEEEMILMAKRLEFEVTNNQAVYEACSFGLEALWNVGAEEIAVYENSMLVVKQISEHMESEGRQAKSVLRLFSYCSVVFY